MSENSVQIRRAQALQDAVDRGADFTPTPGPVLVRVVNLGNIPTSGNLYFACHQVDCEGPEVEGGTATLSEGTEVFYTAVIGSTAPQAGDYLIARPVPSGRWAADVPVTPPDHGINLAGCPCALVPLVLHMDVNNPALNHGIFQPTTLVYGPTPPEYLPLSIGTGSYLSPGSFTDQVTGDSYRYWFTCYSGYYGISRVYLKSVLGSPYRDMFRYTWLAGLRGNSCSPFLLGFGQIYPGGDPACVVTISG